MAPAGFWGVCLGRCSRPGAGAGFGGRGEERRKGQLRTWNTTPPPMQLSLHPKASGSCGPKEQRYQRARKESPKRGGGLEEMSH